MSTSKETGIKVNIDNLYKLIAFLKSLGPQYNPTNRNLTIVSLEQILTDALAAQEFVSLKLQPYSTAADERILAFKPLQPLITRTMSALKANNVSTETTETAKAIVRKIKGRKLPVKKTSGSDTTQSDTQLPNKQKSNTQLGYDDQMINLGELIDLLAIIPQYAPNETDLKTESIRSYRANLAIKNHTAVDTKIALTNARIDRDEIMYKPITGLVDTASNAKSYIKSVFGSTSTQYRQISGLRFSHPKK